MLRSICLGVVALGLLLSGCTQPVTPAPTIVLTETRLPAAAPTQVAFTPTLLPFEAIPEFTLPPLTPLPTSTPTGTRRPPATSTPHPSATGTETTPPTETPTPTSTPTPEVRVRFAVIGDYGSASESEKDVAKMVHSWQPDFILTVGDNNYPAGSESTIDQNIGQFYHDYIYPYHGQYGAGADKIRFFPTLGNHDWMAAGAQPYFDYFELPGNERYYQFTWGSVDFYAIDSDEHEPDGFRVDSPQAQWLKDELAKSTNPWKVVYFHVPPFSSGPHGSAQWMNWPFEDWGATSVLTGHDHTYERLMVASIPYFVNGLGGGAIYSFKNIVEQSQARYNDDWGAMLVTATSTEMHFQFFSRAGQLIDEYVQTR